MFLPHHQLGWTFALASRSEQGVGEEDLVSPSPRSSYTGVCSTPLGEKDLEPSLSPFSLVGC